MSEIHHEQEAPIRAYLSYYINREMVSAWQNLPTTQKELEANLGAAGIGREYITDVLDTLYETEIPDLDRRLPRHPDLDELNHLAILIGDMDEEYRVTFAAVLETTGYWGSIATVINVAENLDSFDFYPGKFSAEELGGILFEMHAEQHLETVDRLRVSDDPDERSFAAYVGRLEASVNPVKYSSHAREAENGYLTSVGYLIPQDDNLPQDYTGPKDIPAEHLVTTRPDAAEHKPSLLGAVAALKEQQAVKDNQRVGAPEKKTPSGPEL
jgi:hypothetical protein